ncbi:MAG: AMP-dependent synthetase [Rhodothermaceae bacterium]|nr:MAG: AMP-dependent synthetase [Rhodothermaceae bacterium]
MELPSASAPEASTLPALLNEQARQRPDAVVLEAPGRPPLSFARLADLSGVVRTVLREAGVGPQDRVASVVPNGPEAATVFLTVASCAVSAPLNPAYHVPEYTFYLSDLGVRAVIVAEGMGAAVREAAAALGLPVLDLAVPSGGPAGVFELAGAAARPCGDDRPARPADVALVLHTSGTTARPKQVPLTHANLCASARHVRQALALTPADRCLNVMPLFHIHGLVAAVLASVSAGASVVCTPGFFAPEVLGWMAAFRPSWYTAVPTMHQAVLAQARAHPERVVREGLRFIRSSSASLPPRVMAGLEATFGVPVIEAYGMTEAAHQIASNPLPPGVRKPGSVGRPAGPEVALMDAAGRLLPTGTAGEVVVRGPNVTAGYAGNPEANARAFTDGWFRTGDEGYLDEDGYLVLTGRIKEMINRGGEKVAPREVDEVLLDHPAVAQAVTFAVPDERLGEEVGAAVVLHAPGAVDARTLRRFVAERLAAFKVPRHIVFVDAIPKGPTGKLQRIGLAERLGVRAVERTAPSPYAPPATPVEEVVAGLWEAVLGHRPVGRHDHFLDLGGDSMLAMRLVARLREHFYIDLSIIDFFEASTVEEQAMVIEDILLSELEDDQPG